METQAEQKHGERSPARVDTAVPESAAAAEPTEAVATVRAGEPSRLTAAKVRALQRTVGNQAVQRLVGVRGEHQGPGAAVRIQRVDHLTHDATPAVAGIMATAGIADFGPYMWDDTVPRFKINPAYTTWTFEDCLSVARHQPEARAVAGERGTKQGLIGARVAAARQALFGIARGVIDKIVANNNGASPRAFVSVAAEDALGIGAHIEQRHVLGGGAMTGPRQVALRAAFQNVGGVAMPLDDTGVASVFGSSATANASVGAVIAGSFTANWAANRTLLIKGNDVKLLGVALSGAAVAYQKQDDPKGTPYGDALIPKYLDSSKAGTRELYRGDFTGAPTDANAPDTVAPALTDDVSATVLTMDVYIKAASAAPGGWYVHTAYPR